MFGNKMKQVEKEIKKGDAAALVKLAEGGDAEVTMAAIAGLGCVGGDDACNFLISRLGNGAPQMRIAVAQALGKIGDKHTKAFVSAQLGKETDPQVREVLTQAMTQIHNY